jgi:hypothetical protein
MALVEMSVVEQRYRAVLAVGRGEPKIVVAAQFGVSRQTLHTWLTLWGSKIWLGMLGAGSRRLLGSGFVLVNQPVEGRCCVSGRWARSTAVCALFRWRTRVR